MRYSDTETKPLKETLGNEDIICLDLLRRVGGNWDISSPTPVVCWLGLITEDHRDSQMPTMMSMHKGNVAD